MTNIGDVIVRQSFVKRVIVPAGMVLAVAVVALIIHNHFWRLGMPALTKIVGHVSFGLFLLSVFLGALFAYPVAYFRGASVFWRIAVCLVTPLCFIGSEVVRVTQFFTWGESLYYALTPANQLIILANLGLMGLAEMICRLRLKRRGVKVRVISLVPVGGIVLFGLGVYVIFLWGMGVHYFYIYMEGYKALFQ